MEYDHIAMETKHTLIRAHYRRHDKNGHWHAGMQYMTMYPWAMSTSSKQTLVPFEGEESEAVARSLAQRLSYMKGRTPSISAVALKGDSTVSMVITIANPLGSIA